MTPAPSVTIEEQIEACEYAAKECPQNWKYGPLLRAAAATLRQVQTGELVPVPEPDWDGEGI
jgi:hypothetical protein